MSPQTPLTLCTNLWNIFISMKCTRLNLSAEFTSTKTQLTSSFSIFVDSHLCYWSAQVSPFHRVGIGLCFPVGIPCSIMKYLPGNGAFGSIPSWPWAAATAHPCRPLLQRVKASGIHQKDWKSQADVHTLFSCSEWTEEALFAHRKALYLPPLHQAAHELILLLGRSGEVGFRYLFQLCRFSEMTVLKRERMSAVKQGFHNNGIIPVLISFQIAMQPLGELQN